MLVGQQYGFSTPFAESPGWQARYGDQEVSPVPLGRDDRREVGHQPRGRWRSSRSPRTPRARTAIDEGRFEDEIVPRRRASTPTSARATPRWRRWPALKPLAPGRPDHRGRRLADLRRVVRAAGRLRAGGRGPRAHAARPDPPPLGARRRPGLDAHRPDPRHRGTPWRRPACRVDDIDLFECNEAFASVVLAWMQETRRRRTRRSTSTAAASPSATRSAPPAPADGHPAQRARAHRRPLRPADDVRGRRPGQRHDHRAALGLDSPRRSRGPDAPETTNSSWSIGSSERGRQHVANRACSSASSGSRPLRAEPRADVGAVAEQVVGAVAGCRRGRPTWGRSMITRCSPAARMLYADRSPCTMPWLGHRDEDLAQLAEVLLEQLR